MTKRKGDVTPKIWRDSPGAHFNPYYDKKWDERRAHERGKEHKTLAAMGARRKDHDPSIHELQALGTRKVPITLSALKWMKP